MSLIKLQLFIYKCERQILIISVDDKRSTYLNASLILFVFFYKYLNLNFFKSFSILGSLCFQGGKNDQKISPEKQ